jgi:hypothetical protein
MTRAATIDARAALRQPQLLFRLTALVIFILMGVSNLMLDRFGIRYDVEGGTVLEKMHPAHLLSLLVLLLLFFSNPRPGDFFNRVFSHHKGSLVFLATWLLLLFQIIVVLKQPFTPVIDTFLFPIVMMLVLAYLGFDDRLRLAHLIHFMMLANSLLAIFEVASGWRLTPLMAMGVELTDEWRASALLGHPLANALITGFYLIVIALGGWRGVPWALRPVLFFTSLVAMNAFGGRMAFMALLLFLAVIYLGKSIGTLRGERSPRRNWILAALLIPTFVALLVVGWQLGLFDRFVERFVADKGSASARVVILDIMHNLSWFDILIGPDPALMQTLLRTYGLQFGIESFWLAYILSYGAIVSVIFFIGLFAYLYDVIHSAGTKALWPLLYFFIVSSTYVSLSAKSTDLALAVAMAVLLLSTAEGAAPVPAARPTRGTAR